VIDIIVEILGASYIFSYVQHRTVPKIGGYEFADLI